MALGGMSSACISHPGVEAVGRCKQCGKPFCNACKVMGPTGLFCSEECKQKHESFVQRAQQFESRKGSVSVMAKVRKMLGGLVAIVILAIILGVLGTIFEIPVLSDLVIRVRDIIGV
ncbi:MAG: hypothetical protein AMXMBFR82_22580 [Candidatus Hydrogenedentota bacterium]